MFTIREATGTMTDTGKRECGFTSSRSFVFGRYLIALSVIVVIIAAFLHGVLPQVNDRYLRDRIKIANHHSRLVGELIIPATNSPVFVYPVSSFLVTFYILAVGVNVRK